jgi:phage-related protein (TIGR01555 family)
MNNTEGVAAQGGSAGIVGRYDGFIHGDSGAGTNADALTKMVPHVFDLTPREARSWYLSSGLIQNIIDAKPSDATRKWIALKTNLDTKDNKKQNLSRLIMNRLDELGLKQKLFDLLQADNLYNKPSYLFPVFLARDPQTAEKFSEEMPAEINKIIAINLITPDHYQTQRRSRNPLSSLYHKKYIKVSGNEIHDSRLIKLEKTFFDEEQKGISLLENILDTVKAHSNGVWSISHLLRELSAKIFQSDEIDNIKDDDKKSFLQKIKSVWSTMNAILIKKNEDFKRLSSMNEMSGFKDSIDFVITSLSMVAGGMPRTRIAGQSAGVIRADQDVLGWYEKINSDQENKIRPIIEFYINLVLREKDGRIYPLVKNKLETLDWQFTFNNLSVPDPQEDAKTNLINAQTHQIYLTTGVLTPDEIRAEIRPDLEPFAEYRGQEFDLEQPEIPKPDLTGEPDTKKTAETEPPDKGKTEKMAT